MNLCSILLTPVVRIDRHVLRSEVTSQHDGIPARCSEIYSHLDELLVSRVVVRLPEFRRPHVRTELRLHLVSLQDEVPTGEDGPPPQRDRQQVGGAVRHFPLQLPQEAPDGRRDPSGVGVVPRHGTLEQGRVDDVPPQRARLFIRARTPADPDPDHVFRPLPVPDDVRRQPRGHLPHGLLELRESLRPVRQGHPRRGQDRDRVAGGLVPVHGDGVVARVHRTRQHRLERGLVHAGRVRKDVREHGGHVRLDHAGPLGDPHDPRAPPQGPATQLRVPVGGHDRSRGREGVPAPRRQLHRGGGDHLPRQLLRREPPPDHARAARQHGRRAPR
mmetsp:Transcript_43035/g.84588  ORF Transcript_43035/g.84588 Transcript_43035/m.84588 type:complete len:330 (+) Transcript_43035:70-1059(+)